MFSAYESNRQRLLVKVENGLKSSPVLCAIPSSATAVILRSDNFGGGFGAERPEGTNAVLQHFGFDDLPQCIQEELDSSPYKNMHVPLSATGLEPDTQEYFRSSNSVELTTLLKAAYVVAFDFLVRVARESFL